MEISVIIPSRNERGCIEKCLRSIEANDYPRSQVEILVVDGMSTDGTRDIVRTLAGEYGNITLLDNPRCLTPFALNIGIRHANGQYIMRVDGHAEVERQYISKCIEASVRHQADNVGGTMRTLPATEGPMAKAIVTSLSHPFGVGNSYFRIAPREPRSVDTVFGGFYRRDVFERIGLFNEKLERGQDIELNLRLNEAGGKIVLIPDIVSTYYARSDLRSFLKHNFANGKWVVLAFPLSKTTPVSVRHLVPLVFLLALTGSGLLVPIWASAKPVLLLVGGSYVALNGVVSTMIGLRQQRCHAIPAMMAAFAGLHLAYGLGSLWGATVLGARKVSTLGAVLKSARVKTERAEECYRLYVADLDGYRAGAVNVGPAYRQVVWSPSLFRVYPPGARGTIPLLTLTFWWLYYLSRFWDRRLTYRIYATYRGDRIVHYSVVFGKNPRFPFMNEGDRQIGPAWTDPHERRKGLQTETLDRIILGSEDPAAKFWWICRESNLVSNTVALQRGFVLLGAGRRTRRFGLRILGSFVPEDRAATRDSRLPDFTTVTETPGTKATEDQLRILYTRYDLGLTYCTGRDVLEVACGAGVGLGLLAKHARRVLAGDIDPRNCQTARQNTAANQKITVQRFDAGSLPFPDASFDLVVLFEALYYLPDEHAFFREARRVLRPGGTLVLSSVNREWTGFNPSPFSTRYYSAKELFDLLSEDGYNVRLLAGFSERTDGILHRLVHAVRLIAIRLRLIPKTMKGKQWLKRLFYGRLTPIPKQLSESQELVDALAEISRDSDTSVFRMLYCVATLATPSRNSSP